MATMREQLSTIWDVVSGGGWCPDDPTIPTGIVTVNPVTGQQEVFDSCAGFPPDFTVLRYGQAYWVYVGHDVTLIYMAVDPVTGEDTGTISQPMYTGWNMFGWLGRDSDPPADSFFGDIPVWLIAGGVALVAGVYLLKGKKK